MSHKRTHTNRIDLLVIFLSALFCLMALRAAEHIVSIRTQSVRAASGPTSLAVEGSAETGTLDQDPKRRQQRLNQVVEEGMLIFPVNATPFVEDGASTANLLIEDPSGNGECFTITIRKSDTREVIYQSGYLDPEQYIDDVLLDVILPKGEYVCTAYFDTYRISDNAYIGSAGAEIKLYVLE